MKYPREMSFPLPSTSTPRGLVVLFGGAVQLQVYLLERGVGHLALSETVIQTPVYSVCMKTNSL